MAAWWVIGGCPGDYEFQGGLVYRPRRMPGFVDQCCVGDVEGLLGFEVTLGRVRAAS